MPETLTAPAPTKTPAAPAIPAIPVAPERAPSDFMAEQESAFADMAEGKTPAPRGRDEKGKFQPAAKPAEKAAEKPVETPPEKPADNDTGLEKPAVTPDEPIKPVKAAELRSAYDGLKKKVKEEYEPAIQKVKSLEAKIAEYESKPPEDNASMLAKLKAVEERNTQLEKHMEYVDFQQSKTFKDNYDDPFTKTWNE